MYPHNQGRPFQVHCDLEEEEGWGLLLNYERPAGSNQELNFLQDGFPVPANQDLSWGQVSQKTLKSIAGRISELRFRCQTSGHNFVVDFSVSDPDSINYVVSGSGSFSGYSKKYRVLNGNTASFSGKISVFGEDQNEKALTEKPFSHFDGNSWAIRSEGEHWSCAQGNVYFDFDSHHQVFFK